MTKITDITGAIDTLVQATLSGISKLPNPYEIEKNPDLLLKNGYGLGFAGAVNTGREVGPCISIGREFVVMLVKEIAQVEFDAAGIQTQALALYENEISLIKAFEGETNIGGAFNFRYVSSDELTYVVGETNKYFMLTTTFYLEYAESV